MKCKICWRVAEGNGFCHRHQEEAKREPDVLDQELSDGSRPEDSLTSVFRDDSQPNLESSE